MLSTNWLTTLPTDRPVVLLLRHAEREPIEKLEDTVAAALTPAGISRAEELGRGLAQAPRILLWHSPVGRCRQTAEAIARGAERGGCRKVELVGPLPVLGGPYMLDWRAVMPRVIEHGAGPFVRRWFSGELEPGLVREARASAREQLLHLQLQASESKQPGLLVNISHDWNLLLVRHFYLERGRQLFGWPEYLEGLALYPQGAGWRLRRGDLERAVTAERPA